MTFLEARIKKMSDREIDNAALKKIKKEWSREDLYSVMRLSRIDDEAASFAFEPCSTLHQAMYIAEKISEENRLTIKLHPGEISVSVNIGMFTAEAFSENLNMCRAICECFLLVGTEEKCVSTDFTKTREYKDSEILLEWLEEKGIKQVYRSQIQRIGPNQLRKKERCAPAIKILVEDQILKPLPHGTVIDGKPRVFSWSVHAPEF